MYPEQARDEVLERIKEIEVILDDPANDQLVNKDDWVKKFDEEMDSLTRGLKMICVDNGDIGKSSKYKTLVENEWKRVRNKFTKESSKFF